MKILTPDIATARTQEHAQPKGPAGASPAEKRAAQEFEAIFLRKMLASMEKSSKVEGASLSGGADAYSSMVVGALADAIAAAGGIGLGESVLRSVATEHAAVAAPTPPDKTSSLSDLTTQGSKRAAVQGSGRVR
jgi:flagellar protein FlgJ